MQSGGRASHSVLGLMQHAVGRQALLHPQGGREGRPDLELLAPSMRGSVHDAVQGQKQP